MTDPQNWPVEQLNSAQIYALMERSQHALQAAIDREHEEAASAQQALAAQAAQLRALGGSVRGLAGSEAQPEPGTLRQLLSLPDEHLVTVPVEMLRAFGGVALATAEAVATVCDVSAAAVELGATQATH